MSYARSRGNKAVHATSKAWRSNTYTRSSILKRVRPSVMVIDGTRGGHWMTTSSVITRLWRARSASSAPRSDNLPAKVPSRFFQHQSPHNKPGMLYSGAATIDHDTNDEVDVLRPIQSFSQDSINNGLTPTRSPCPDMYLVYM